MGVIAETRVSHGLTQMEYAKLLGISRPAVSQLEVAEDAGTMKLSSLKKALEVFDLEPTIVVRKRGGNHG